MDIKYSYYLIILIYLLVLTLRFVNTMSTRAFKKRTKDYKKAFSIKKDFFTTVTTACILVTIAINAAALIGGRPFNTSSVTITLLVIGFTIINSCYPIIFSEEDNEICWLGYELKIGDIESLKVKESQLRYTFNMTFAKNIDSYDYAKVVVFGKNKKALKRVLENIKVKNKEE